MSSIARIGLLLFTAASAGCAAHRKEASVTTPPPALAQYIAKVRAASLAPPPKKAPIQTIEQLDPQLKAALAEVLVAPSAASYRNVAAQYARLHIFDTADKYLTMALGFAKNDASLYDARARVQRDAGFPGLGLGDAYRAWNLAPTARSATTLGTMFEGLGQLKHARDWYEKARSMEPAAWYALNNLCHLDTMQAHHTAVESCSKALAVAPNSAVAQNNLALAYAVAGNLDKAREHFAAAGGATTAAYNMGIIYLAKKQFEDAENEFRAAWQAKPTKQAADRLAQSIALQHSSR